jgi:hypothetical protein
VKALQVIVLACLASLGLLGLEWGYPRAPVATPRGTPILPLPAGRAHSVLASLPAADLVGLVRDILARPLFSQMRRPAYGADRPVAQQDPTLPRLSGILLLPSLRRAIFEAAGAKGQIATIVGETGKIDDWTVESIAGDGVTLARSGETMFLAPAFASAEAARAAPPVPPLSLWEAPAAQGILRARWSNPQLQP